MMRRDFGKRKVERVVWNRGDQPGIAGSGVSAPSTRKQSPRKRIDVLWRGNTVGERP